MTHERIMRTAEYRDRCISSGLDEAVDEIAAANAALASGEVFTLLVFSDGQVKRRFGCSLADFDVLPSNQEGSC